MIWWAIIIGGAFFFATYACNYSYTVYFGREVKRVPNAIFVIITILIIVLFAGLRLPYGVGCIGDTGDYSYGFMSDEVVPDSPILYLENTSLEGDWGFNFIRSFVKMFTSDPQIWLVIVSAITFSILIVFYYRYAQLFNYAVFIFCTTQFCGMMNAQRQSLAGAIVLLAIPFIKEKKWHLYFLLIILAAQIHNSAYFFIIVYFLNSKAWGLVTKLIIGIGGLAFIFYGTTVDLLSLLLSDSTYSNYSTIIGVSGSGASVIRFIVSLVPIILAWFARETLREREKHYGLFLHLAMIASIFTLLAGRHWIFNRYTQYFQPFSVVLVCWGIKYGFDENSTKIVKLMAIVLYGFFFWYEIIYGMRMPYLSNIIAL